MSNEVSAAQDQPGDERALAIGRLIAGAVQGLVLYLLYLSNDNHAWPSTDPYWMAPLLLVFVFVPLLFGQALGTMRARTLLIWTVAATLILAGLAWYDMWRRWQPETTGGDDMTFALVIFSTIGLFIAQSLIAAGDSARKYVAPYSAYFDAAWKLGVQVALAAVFVGVFWGVLWLGAVLFNLIKLSFLETLIEKSWFAIPATTLATAAAIHVTDVRARLVAGIRTVALTLLSWLLPLMTLIAAGFTASLPFTGLEPLWATRSAAGLLLTAAAALVILINAAFQDGDPEHNRPRVLRFAKFAASLVIVPLVLIAAYALWLRVAQYGWTVERIATAATIVVALCYAFGYAAAALLSLRGGALVLERVNIATSYVVLAVILALFTPLADPARIAVNSQVARLKAGLVDAAKFDYAYLKAEGGAYGHAALTDLAQGEFGHASVTIHKMARDAIAGVIVTPGKPTVKEIARNITVYPKGSELPPGFLERDWGQIAGAPGCLTGTTDKCDAFFADLDGDGHDEVVLVSENGIYLWGVVFKQNPDKSWDPVANFNGQCVGMIEALRKGETQVEQPPPGWRDWVVAGVHIRPMPLNPYQAAPCPAQFK